MRSAWRSGIRPWKGCQTQQATSRIENPGSHFRRRHLSNCIRDVNTERRDPGLQPIIEHVANHQHAAAHPLTGSAKLGMTELRQAAPTAFDRLGKVSDGCCTYRVLGSKLIDVVLVEHASSGRTVGQKVIELVGRLHHIPDEPTTRHDLVALLTRQL
jgi:hypothetical protein